MAGLGAGLVAGAIAQPLTGVAVGVATALALLVPRLRILLGLAAITAIVATGAYVALHQHADHVPAGGDWTGSFGAAGRLAWAAVAFLGADGLVELIVRRRPSDPAAEPTAGRPDAEHPVRRYQQRLSERATAPSRGRRPSTVRTGRPTLRRLGDMDR
jgi:hypothetical protein